MSQSSAIGPSVADLEDLAVEANTQHVGALAAAADALSHAIAAGEALLAARELVPHGGWERWVDENFAAPTMAKPYMRLATYKHLLPGDVQLSQIDALRYLRGLPGTTGNAPTEEVAGLKDEALRLRDAGFTQREVAQILSIGKATIYRWEHGRGDHRGSTRADLAQRRAERRALKERRRQRVLARAPDVDALEPGDALAQAHSLIADLSAVLRDTVRRTSHPEAKGAIVDALTRLATAEEDIRVAAQICAGNKTHEPEAVAA